MTAPHVSRWLAIVMLLGFGWVVVQNAWLGDDAFITFRTVDNWIEGHGLRWNITERVQTFTNPLWLFLLGALHVVTQEIVITSLVTSVVLSLLALGLVLWAARSRAPVMLALALVATVSRAFVDYSTSGLENALGHLLVVAFVIYAIRTDGRRRLELALLASLLALNRLDTILLTMPTLGWTLWRERSRAAWGQILLGLTPLILWESFSLLYYGFPFPNTAYAKLGSGVPALALVGQGMRYLQNSLTSDPITLPMILGAVVLGLRGRASSRTVAAGLVLYLLYVLRIGGDFMSGRFLSTPLGAALALSALQAERIPPRLAWGVTAVAFVLAGAIGQGPVRTGPHHYEHILRDELVDAYKIADERGFYFPATNPLWGHADVFPDHPWANWGRTFRGTGQFGYVRGSEMGMKGYYAGPNLHMLDRFGLVDPLIARLPAVDRKEWRIGHFRRRFPEGYYDSLRFGVRQITDPGVQEFHDKLVLITRGPLFDGERLSTIVRMNLGLYDHLLRTE